MGLRCSVLGHHYGEKEFVEERDRQGSEVVLTAREVKTCERCGHTLVVSESKEVTTVEERETAEPSSPDPEPTDAPEQSEPQVGEQHARPAEEDDGLIMEDEPEERERGAWPGSEEEADEPTDPDIAWPEIEHPEEAEEEEGGEGPPPAWPSTEGEDEGFDAVAGEVDDDIEGEIIETTRRGKETESGFFRAEPMDGPADPDETGLRTEYFCPQCNWSAPSLNASVRRGDVCPNCQRGYVAERDPD